MKILVTGGAGFLGTHLCRALASAGHQVTVLDLKVNPEFPTIQADIRDAELMKSEIKDFDAVFHLAALIEAGESVKFPQQFIDTNVTGSLNVLEAMRQNNITTFVFSSSAAVYGEPERVPIQEDDRTMPINPYGMTKLAMEALLSSYVATYGFTGIALRYFNLYGPAEKHDPETHAIPRFIKQMYNGEEVTVWGEGEHQRDFVYIADIVDAHLKALDLAVAQPRQYHYFNLSAEEPTAVIDVIRMLEKLLGKPAQITHFDPRPGDPLVLVADALKAHEKLGWHAHVNLEVGLKKTVDWFVGQWSAQER